MTDWTPRLPPPKPPRARQHCRHYGYVVPITRPDSGPQCTAGVDNRTAPRATLPCMPDPKEPCALRQEWTADERAAWEAWSAEHHERLVVIMTAIPREGFDGSMPCPGCGVGTVRWGRARSNKHLHAACSTPHCFQVMQ
jgi:hypothetical protein